MTILPSVKVVSMHLPNCIDNGMLCDYQQKLAELNAVIFTADAAQSIGASTHSILVAAPPPRPSIVATGVVAAPAPGRPTTPMDTIGQRWHRTDG
jgi:hypothetical protein